MYREWPNGLPGTIAAAMVQLPGREARWTEKPFARMSDLIGAATAAIAPCLAGPYALYGHSMGALIAYELAVALESVGLVPEHLFVSSYRAPQMPARLTPIHQLDDDGLIAAVQHRYGGIPDQLLREPELLKLFVPCLRADFTLLETYEPALRRPLSCPISAFGGTADEAVTIDELDGWRAQTGVRFTKKLFNGGHFFLNAARHELLSDIVSSLNVGTPGYVGA